VDLLDAIEMIGGVERLEAVVAGRGHSPDREMLPGSDHLLPAGAPVELPEIRPRHEDREGVPLRREELAGVIEEPSAESPPAV
jgi:hypothetical protein